MSDLKLHLGCNNKKIYGFTNVDLNQEVQPDIVEDIIKLPSFYSNSASVILVVHVAEHLSREQSKEAFKRWYEILKPGGVLRISVPDLDIIFRHYVLYQDLRLLERLLYGSQLNQYQFHYNGWNEQTLREDLHNVGFSLDKINRYDWRTTEHAFLDDYSQAYLDGPNKTMDKTKLLVSLNIQAIK